MSQSGYGKPIHARCVQYVRGLGNEFEAFWAVMLLLGCLMRSWGCLEGGLGSVLGSFDRILRRLGRLLGGSWSVLGRLGASWGRLGGVLGAKPQQERGGHLFGSGLGVGFGGVSACLGPSWDRLGAYFGLA